MSRPRLGFLGTGWIGRNRMAALIDSELIEAAAICDPSPECAAEATKLAAGAEIIPSFEAMLDRALDGVVIATPSALHAGQAIAALERGMAVFCQKPLGRDADEVRRVVETACKADRLLAVDLSYRRTAAAQAIAASIRSGELGSIFAADLTFHNAYGPDKPWFYDRGQSGGGCVMDLGIHLVDLALWLLDFPDVDNVEARLFAKGKPLSADSTEVEDYAAILLDLAGGAVVRLACSWNLHAGREAVIAANLHGSAGGVAMRNIDGSFYDFEATRHDSTAARQLCSPPDAWGGRAVIDWAERLGKDNSFSNKAAEFIEVAKVLDRIYAR